MLWTKQFYYYVVEQWLDGDPAQPPPPAERKTGRNAGWRNLYNERVMSMPDTWEFPWYAAWDLGFHCIPIALVDPHFAKAQLDIILREWYQHPNGQIPAYEWNFSDVNPPVIGWAAWRVYKIEQHATGKGDRAFLETVFHKLLINFTWWVNRKDSGGRNIFEGGFLGLDNIGVFDRSESFPDGTRLEQSDGTSWMGMFCLTMMRIALELARENPVYENIATKFFEHFLGIAAAMNNVGGQGIGLWDEADEFFYDVLHTPGGRYLPLRVHSLVGLMPLLAVEVLEPAVLEAMPGFRERLEWYLTNRPDLASLISRWYEPGSGDRRLIALTRGHRMKCLLRRMLDPNEFLSDYGVRSLSKFHEQNPYVLEVRGEQKVVDYEPAESRTGLFGGNSNWRGPVWFPINYLLIESLQKFHHYYGDDFKVECPTGSGQFVTLDRGCERAFQPPDQAFPPRWAGRAAVHARFRRFVRQDGRSAALSFPRVFPRRHRRRSGRKSSDRLDRSGGQVDSATGNAGDDLAARAGRGSLGSHLSVGVRRDGCPLPGRCRRGGQLAGQISLTPAKRPLTMPPRLDRSNQSRSPKTAWAFEAEWFGANDMKKSILIVASAPLMFGAPRASLLRTRSRCLQRGAYENMDHHSQHSLLSYLERGFQRNSHFPRTG